MVAIASRGSQQLSRRVNDIIDLERLEGGTFGIHTAPHDLSPLLLDATESLSPLAPEAGTLVVVDPVSAHVVCDGDCATQALVILVNMVGNVLKFTSPGGSVTLSARAANGSAQVCVRDTGRGIPQSELSAIFDRFHQVDPDDSPQDAGTGLGLATTQGIEHAHGGTTWAESTRGVGSAFHLTLPLDASHTRPGVPLAEAEERQPAALTLAP